MRAGVLLLGLLVLSGCDEKTVAGPSVPINRVVTLAPGKAAEISEAAITIRFVGVPSDSRCPGDALCITAGDATVRIEVQPPSVDGHAQYDLHIVGVKAVTHGDLTIALEQLEPFPFYSRGPIQPNDYRATFRVTR